jgi:hypothetical protein
MGSRATCTLAAVLVLSGCASQGETRQTFTGTAKAYSTEAQIGLKHKGHSYAVPVDLRWQDEQGAWHERGRPACLPPNNSEVGPVRFGAVAVEAPDGPSWRQVVWISCKP